MKRLLALTLKEFRQLVRDHLTLRMIVMVPLMQMIIFGYAINFDVKHLPMVVLDESRSFESRELVAKMQASQYFDLVGSVNSFEEVRRTLDTAAAMVALVIDADFGRDRRQGSPAHAMLIVNASDSTTSSQAITVVGQQAAPEDRAAEVEAESEAVGVVVVSPARVRIVLRQDRQRWCLSRDVGDAGSRDRQQAGCRNRETMCETCASRRHRSSHHGRSRASLRK